MRVMQAMGLWANCKLTGPLSQPFFASVPGLCARCEVPHWLAGWLAVLTAVWLLPRPIAATRECMLTGKRANNGYVVTFSHKRNKKLQQVNLQYKKVYWPEGQRWVKLRICTKAMKTIEKKGLQIMANEAGLDLWKLPFEDARPQRRCAPRFAPWQMSCMCSGGGLAERGQRGWEG